MSTAHVERPQIDDSNAAVPARRPEPCVMVIFGASGDLTRRKLVPALYQLAVDDQLPECFRIVGFARSKKDRDTFRRELHEGVSKFARNKPVNDSAWDRFAAGIEYHQAS